MVEILQAGAVHRLFVVGRLALGGEHGVMLVGGEAAVAVVGSDVGVREMARLLDEAGLGVGVDLVHRGHHDEGSVDLAEPDLGPDRRLEAVGALRRQGRRRLASVDSRRGEVRLGEPQDEQTAGAVGEGRDTLQHRGREAATAIFDFDVLQVRPRGPQRRQHGIELFLEGAHLRVAPLDGLPATRQPAHSCVAEPAAGRIISQILGHISLL